MAEITYKSRTEKELFKAYCENTGQWGIYLHGWEGWGKERLLKVAPYLSQASEEFIEAGGGYLFFDTEEEMEAVYSQIKCDNAEFPIYALTCSNQGEFLDENT